MSLEQQKLNLICDIVAITDEKEARLLQKIIKYCCLNDTEELEDFLDYKRCYICYEPGRNYGCQKCLNFSSK